MIPLPWRLLGGLVMVLALFLGGYGVGANYAKTECVAGQVEAQTASVAAATKEDVRRETIGTARETSREQIRIVYKTLKEQAHETVNNHPEFNACGLDADGLRLWNAANAGTAATLPGEPDRALPAADRIPLGQSGGSAAEPYRGDGAGSAVSGPVEQTGSVQP